MIQNPVRQVRERNGMSLDKFSSTVGIHLQAVYLNEQGVYHSILPAIRDWMVKQGYDVVSLDEQYAQYQEESRIEAGTVLKASEVELPEPSAIHPFIEFRKQLGVSRMGISKMLAIHPAFLYKLERGEAHGLSHQAKVALLEAGFSSALVTELDFRCAEFASNRSPERTAS